MDLLLSVDEHHGWIRDHVARMPDRVLITSFGVWAGILVDGRDTQEWGSKFKLETAGILRSLEEAGIESNILVGVSDYRSCKKDGVCLDCERSFVSAQLRLLAHARAFGGLRWRFTSQLHIKTVLMVFGRELVGLVGGRNFTGSDWVDCSVVLDGAGARTLLKHNASLWGVSSVVDEESVVSFLKEQGISEEAMDPEGW